MEKLQWLWGGSERLKTTQGKVAFALTVFVIVGSLTSRSGSGAFVPLLVFSPLIWRFWWWATGATVATWEGLVEGKPPVVYVGRVWQSSSVQRQLREDTNGEVFVDHGGILRRERYWFVASGTPPIRLSVQEYQHAREQQEQEPVLIATYRDRNFWWYDAAIYWTNNWEYDSEDVKGPRPRVDGGRQHLRPRVSATPSRRMSSWRSSSGTRGSASSAAAPSTSNTTTSSRSRWEGRTPSRTSNCSALAAISRRAEGSKPEAGPRAPIER
jgi:hypothetical protein